MFQNAGEKGRKHRDPLDPPRRRANKQRGHGTWDTDRPRLPVLSIATRATSGFVSRAPMIPPPWSSFTSQTNEKAIVNTDEWGGYNTLPDTGRTRKAVCHSPLGASGLAMTTVMGGVKCMSIRWRASGPASATSCALARGNAAGLFLVENLWTGLRSFLRPFRGVSKYFLDGYLAVFEWAHNLKTVTVDFLLAMTVLFTSVST